MNLPSELVAAVLISAFAVLGRSAGWRSSAPRPVANPPDVPNFGENFTLLPELSSSTRRDLSRHTSGVRPEEIAADGVEPRTSRNHDSLSR